ncbi:nicotinamide mononucleotide deamidase-related protein [soil metagenome]
MTERLRTSVVVVGDEILGGFVEDTNSRWLARRLQRLGIPLERIVTVPDERAAIGEAIVAELSRSRPRVLLTSGGIGSTPDDLTLESVAAAIGVGVVRQPEIDERITEALEWSAERGVDITEGHETSMRRMALVPDGAYLLPGARGIAPGIAVDVDGGSSAQAGATIVVLPGIPSELERIVINGVEPALLAGRGVVQHVAELTHPYPESVLNPVLERLVREFEDVHVGSYPGAQCLVRLEGARERVEPAFALLREAVDALDADPGLQRLRDAWQARARSRA